MNPLERRNVLIKKTHAEPSALDLEIKSVLNKMQDITPDTDEYGLLLDRLEKLYKMKVSDKDDRKRVSADTIVMVGANLAGIVMILGFERAHVITSKALSFVLKSKV